MEALQEVIINSAISILTILIGIAVSALKGWLDAKRKEIETKHGADQLQIVDKIAQTTVNYVEQVFSDMNGKEKLYKALNTAQKELIEHGIYVTDDQLQVFIESAVKEANKSWKADK